MIFMYDRTKYSKQYRLNHKEELKEKRHLRYINNKSNEYKYHKEYIDKNRDKINKYMRERYIKIKEDKEKYLKLKLNAKRYYKNHKIEINNKRKEISEDKKINRRNYYKEKYYEIIPIGLYKLCNKVFETREERLNLQLNLKK